MPIEIERKFTLAEGRRVTTLGEGLRLGERRQFSLSATYFDTPMLTLARNGITLRRRTGGTDAGWHLKLPTDGVGRQEVHEPISRGQSRVLVPAPLRALVDEVVRREPLLPVAQLRTRRTETDITTPRGRRLAVLCDDRVNATRSSGSASWRELEVELSGGSEDDLARIAEALLAIGCEPKASTSKLAEALGEELSRPAGTLGPKSSARDVLMAYIAEQVGAIQAREAQARVDAPEGVHKMRVATRRLRSTLRTFRPLLDEQRTEPLRSEVKWLSERLGGPRDAEVLKARLLAEVAALPDDEVVGPVRERLAHELDLRHEQTLAELRAALDSARHRRLGEALVALLTDPPLGPQADRKAPKVLDPLLARAGKRVTTRWTQAMAAEDLEREVLVHETRKKAKAARYAWEAVVPAYQGGEAAATAWSEVTEVLGQAQDSVVARERLHELAGVAHAAGESAFTYGLLWERQREAEGAAQHEADACVRAAVRAARKA